VQGVLARLPWYHQLTLLDKLRDEPLRRWYLAKAILPSIEAIEQALADEADGTEP
jgi:hypothetical protein